MLHHHHHYYYYYLSKLLNFNLMVILKVTLFFFCDFITFGR
jgi:hypothetical protein